MDRLSFVKLAVRRGAGEGKTLTYLLFSTNVTRNKTSTIVPNIHLLFHWGDWEFWRQ